MTKPNKKKMTTKLTLFLKFNIIKRYYPGPGRDLALDALAITLPNLQKALIPSNRMLQNYHNSHNFSDQNFINFALTIKKENFIHEKDYYDLKREFYLNFRSVKEFHSAVWRRSLILSKLIGKPSWMDDKDYNSLENEHERLIDKYRGDINKIPIISSIPIDDRKSEYSLQEEEKIIAFLSSALTNKSIIDNDSLKYCAYLINLKTTIMKDNEKLKGDSSLLFTTKSNLLLALFNEYIKTNLPDQGYILSNSKNRDRIEFENCYHGKTEPITVSGIAIKALLNLEKPLCLTTLDDNKQELYRLKKTEEILINYNKDLSVKQLLEILRRCELIVNNDAGYKNHIPYLEGQGAKLDKKAYDILMKEKPKAIIRLSEEENNWILNAVRNKTYKMMVNITNPDDAIVLDSLRLHVNLVIDHPTNKDKCFIIGFLTSSNDGKTIPLSNQQEFLDINQTTDTSKLPQFTCISNSETSGQRQKNNQNNEENKRQYFRFNQKVIIADKQTFVENSLATNHIHNGVNENGDFIATLLLDSLYKTFDSIKTTSLQEPITFTSELLMTIALIHIQQNIDDLTLYIKDEQTKLNNFSSSEREKYLGLAEKKKQKYLDNYRETIYRRIVTVLYPNYVYFLKIKDELEIQQKLYKKYKRNQKQREANIEAKAAHENKQKQKFQDEKSNKTNKDETV